jgi:tetratricopeptide (TPR) repeat protein
MCWSEKNEKAGRFPVLTWIRRKAKTLLSLFVIGVYIIVISPAASLAHEEPHLQIDKLTVRIKQDPANADLYLARGELHRVSSHWDLALADFDRVAELSPDLETIDFHRGRLMFDAGWLHRAKDTLNHFLEAYPRHTQGLIIRGRVLRKLGHPLEAAHDYSRALSLASSPGPDLFVERAQALCEAGDEHLGAAVEGLDEAIRRLGPLVVLASVAIDLEVKRNRYDAALDRIDQVLAQLARKERWIVRRAEILQKAGRTEEARATYQAALAAVESLPPHLRQTPASRELETRLRTLLAGKKFKKAASGTPGSGR